MIDYDVLEHDGSSIFLAEKPDEIESYLDFLKSNEIKTIVVLIPQKDLEEFYKFDLLETYRSHGIRVIHFPINDFGVPGNMNTFDDLILSIDAEARKNHILIHCSAGIGRTGLVAAAHMIRKIRDVRKALEIVREVRWGAVENETQEEFLKTYLYMLEEQD